MKNIFFTLLTLLLAFSSSVTVSFAGDDPIENPLAITRTFTDVYNDDFFFTGVEYLVDKEIVSGYAGTQTYGPDNSLTRAEMLKIVFNAIDLNPQFDANYTFPDVDSDMWYAPYISQAFQENFVQGNTDGNFYPNRAVTHSEAVKIAMNVIGIPTSENYNSALYTDVLVSDWVAPYAQSLVDNNLILILSLENKFFPNKEMLRGVMADMVFRMLIGQQEGFPFSYEQYMFPETRTVIVDDLINITLPLNWSIRFAADGGSTTSYSLSNPEPWNGQMPQGITIIRKRSLDYYRNLADPMIDMVCNDEFTLNDQIFLTCVSQVDEDEYISSFVTDIEGLDGVASFEGFNPKNTQHQFIMTKGVSAK